MKASKLIEYLQKIIDENGDLSVYVEVEWLGLDNNESARGEVIYSPDKEIVSGDAVVVIWANGD